MLEPVADGFRNYREGRVSRCRPRSCSIDRAQLLTLTAPEMTVLVGGLRVLDANCGGARHGVFTAAARNADQRLLRQPARHGHGVEGDVDAEGRVRRPRSQDRRSSSGPPRASIWCSARTRSCARSPRSMAASDAQEKFVRDFVAAWTKVMNLDRFDLTPR